MVLGAVPDGRYDHPPEPTEANLRTFAAIVPAVGAAVGFAQDPDADRLAVVDETGRYIGEELTLALAARRRLEQARGPVVINLSTSMTDGEAGDRPRIARSTARRSGEINVVERMIAEKALLGGEGNGGVIDPRVGYVRDSFVAMAMILDLMAVVRVAAFPAGRRASPVQHGQGPVSDRPRLGTGGCTVACPASGNGSPRPSPTLAPIAATGCGWNGTTVGCTSGPATPSRSSA